MKTITVSLVILFAFSRFADATHIRGGYIKAKSVSATSYTYEIEFVGLNDTGSSVVFGGGEVDFGDGTTGILDELADFNETTYYMNEVAIRRIRLQYTFQGPGVYTISLREFYRNSGISNMTSSLETPFFVSTTITIDPLLGANSTPSLVNVPAVNSKAGATFFNSFACHDAEGDSLVYSLSVPMRNKGEEVAGFRWPNSPEFYEGENRTGKPAFSLNRLSGLFTWATPMAEGEFSMAYRVLEYRKVDGVVYKMSDTSIDLQIINKEAEEELPGLDFSHEASDGHIQFTLVSQAQPADSLEWSLWTSRGQLSLEGSAVAGHEATDTVAGSVNVSGTIAVEDQPETPVMVVAAVRNIHSPNYFQQMKSFAIHPGGGEYVLTSIARGSELGELTIMPNPASSSVSVRFPGQVHSPQARVVLLNAAGQSILNTHVPIRGNLAILGLEGLSGGVYFIRTYLDGKMYYSRFIKE